jgi:short-subunit dehydrogenase
MMKKNKGLAKDGYRVVVIARNRQNLDKVSDKIVKSDDNELEAVVFPLGITDHERLDN